VIWRRPRRRPAVALVAGAAVLAAACTGPAAPTDPAAPQPGNAAPTAAAGSAAPMTGPMTAPTVASTTALRPFYEQRLRWRSCGGPYQCAELTVPMDYARPAGPRIQISVLRVPAQGRGKPLGSLVINPGGPGASGVEYAREARAAITAPVRERYDIVGFDPRGVGQSSPVDCVGDAELDQFVAMDGSPDNSAETRALIRVSQSFAEECARRSGALLNHVGTESVARDLDILRAALGDEQLHYLGKSYGSFIGATYAQLFPTRVGRLVLDGAVDPSLDIEEKSLAQAAGFEQALAAFVADCQPQAFCPLRGGQAQGIRQVRDLLEQLDRRPLPTGEERRLTQSLGVLGVIVPLYEGRQGWPVLAVALRGAFAGDGSTLLRLADLYLNRRSDGRYDDNQNEAIIAVNCIDQPGNAPPEQIQASLPRFRRASPTFGDYLAWGSLPCEYWPARPAGAARPITAAGAKPILVVGTIRDPATPYDWAVGLARQLKSGVLLTYVGDGHTAYARHSACIDGAVENYLLRGRPPRDGTRCA
jgi:pimeloyl-ACP methyl ester carboxylesterase